MNLRIWYEKSAILGWLKVVSGYAERGKKNLKKFRLEKHYLRNRYEKQEEINYSPRRARRTRRKED